jgi:hypothetical protein
MTIMNLEKGVSTMRIERTIETKIIPVVSFTEHLALLCKMLEAAENAESTAEEVVELAEPVAA